MRHIIEGMSISNRAKSSCKVWNIEEGLTACGGSLFALECIYFDEILRATKIINAPVIIKFVFQRLTLENTASVYACINMGEAYAPDEIKDRSIIINDDIGAVIHKILY